MSPASCGWRSSSDMQLSAPPRRRIRLQHEPQAPVAGADQRTWASIPLQQAGDLVAAIALGQLQGTIGPVQQVIETAVFRGKG